MIKVEICVCDERIIGFAATGHSGTAPRGEDIVCAGVSALTQAAAIALMEHLHRRLDCKQASGELRLTLTDDPDELTESVLQTMYLGVREIARQYPQAVRLTITEMG